MRFPGAGADMNRNKTQADEVVETIEENVRKLKSKAFHNAFKRLQCSLQSTLHYVGHNGIVQM